MIRYTYYMTQQILSYFQIGVAVLLGSAILLQQKGQGLSGAFGGEGGFYRTKRGLEKTLMIGTVVLAALFIGIGIYRVAFLAEPAFVPPLPDQQTVEVPTFELGTEPTNENPLPISIPEIEVKTD